MVGPIVLKFTNARSAVTAKPETPGTVDADRQALRERARQAIARQPARTVTTLSSLLAVQDALGYLPPEAIDEVARRTSATVNEVWGVASFYPNFRFHEPARHSVELCWGPTCHLLGAQGVFQGLLPLLKLENEGDTADGTVSFKLNTCLGVCPHGPAMSFDHELAGHMTLERAARRIELLKAADEEQQRSAELLEEAAAARSARAAVRAKRAAAAAEAARVAEKVRLADVAEAEKLAEAVKVVEAARVAKVAEAAKAAEAEAAKEKEAKEKDTKEKETKAEKAKGSPTDEAPTDPLKAEQSETATDDVAADTPAGDESPGGNQDNSSGGDQDD